MFNGVYAPFKLYAKLSLLMLVFSVADYSLLQKKKVFIDFFFYRFIVSLT